MTEFKNCDDFLNYRGSEGGGGTKRLKSWAKEKGFLNFWLHTQQMPLAVWYHRVPELVVRTDRDDPTRTLRNVWGRQYACWEDESILKKQRFRTPDGLREHPPKACGLCRLVEAVREMIRDGKCKDTDVLFEFSGSDKVEENKLLHAGGIANWWKRDDIDDAEKKRLADAGVFMSKVWDENVVAKLNYIFVGVDQDNVAEGVQVAVQTQLVGDKVKRAINDDIASKGGDLGNPFLNPYCLQLVYKPEEKKFDDKYHARRVDRFPLTSEIERHIRGEKPDIGKFTKKFNQLDLRSKLEARATPIGKKLPWDAIFAVPNLGSSEEAPPEPKKASVPVAATLAPAPSAAPHAELGDPCDDCGSPMTKTQTKCGKCGAVYATDEAAAAPAVAASPPPPDDGAVYDSDEIPF